MPVHVQAYAALERGGALQPWSYDQRDARPHDVRFEVLFCGVCHTDLHSIGPWGQHFPLVPGHEMVGRVTESVARSVTSPSATWSASARSSTPAASARPASPARSQCASRSRRAPTTPRTGTVTA